MAVKDSDFVLGLASFAERGRRSAECCPTQSDWPKPTISVRAFTRPFGLYSPRLASRVPLIHQPSQPRCGGRTRFV